MTTTTKKAAKAKVKRAPKGADVRQNQKPAKKLSQIEAAVGVLRAAGEPMTDSRQFVVP